MSLKQKICASDCHESFGVIPLQVVVSCCFGGQGKIEWHKCLGKRKKQTNYLVKFSSDSRDALDSHLMNIGFPVVLSAHFLASFFIQFVVPEVLVDSQQLYMVTKEHFSILKISYHSELCVGLGDN